MRRRIREVLAERRVLVTITLVASPVVAVCGILVAARLRSVSSVRPARPAPVVEVATGRIPTTQAPRVAALFNLDAERVGGARIPQSRVRQLVGIPDRETRVGGTSTYQYDFEQDGQPWAVILDFNSGGFLTYVFWGERGP